MLTDVRLVQLENALFGIDVSPSESIIEVIPEQPEKAVLLKDVTDPGIETEVSPEAPSNA